MSDDTDAATDLAGLKAVSLTEASVREKLQPLGDLAPASWSEYGESVGVVSDYVSTLDGGNDQDRAEWHRALAEVGERRRRFAGEASDVAKRSLDEARERLAAERADLEKVTEALEDVKSAIDDSDEAQRLTGVVFRLKELAEFAEHPSAKKGFDLVRGKVSEDEHLVAEGIGNLGQYEVLTTLASHGFASVEELQRRVETAHQHVSEAAEVFEQHEDREQLADEYKDWTPQG
jgi:DNA repair exonuclease SbcCD ATPase subunit